LIGILLNPRSGYVANHGLPHVRALIADILPDAQVQLLEQGDDVAARCRALLDAGATCIAAGGGDGTVNAVATHLVGTSTPLGVLPVGTLNHFARDVGVGRDVPTALRVLAEGYVAPVDVAMVNQRLFLNNSSIGLYARMVEVRERYERRLGKWRALAYAALLVGRYAKTTQVSVSDGDTSERLHTYLLFVGNNQYELDLLRIGRRARLDAGQLCCFILEGPDRLTLLPHIFHYLRDHRPARGMFRSLCTPELTVTISRKRRIDVAYDGEVVELTTPLVYRVLPRALRVVVPVPPPPESREVRSGGDDEITRLDQSQTGQ
jgi:diacylglycerol kinase family enzyme